ncbi:hypothetical protein L1987_71248 [Smallanthus sonchifolius]|uniref:Uncharacterized protein n=1 Tax=Smallanthus sonchifolius TaxID=185202 RepID=A0ACB9ARV4_9ASTR|nr:hypothetical protein L1987_71248 [Smallanthus sonchifolius]
MPQEDEVTSFVSCTSVSANYVSDSERESVGKSSDSVIVVEDECYNADMYEQKSKDPFFKKKFVKRPQQSDIKGNGLAKPFVKPKPVRIKVDKTRKVEKSMVFVKKDIPESSQARRMDNSSVKKFVKKNVISHQRRNKQLQKLLLQSDPSLNSGYDDGLCNEYTNNGMGNSKSVFQKSVTGKSSSLQSWKPKIVLKEESTNEEDEGG